jgi:hypothetical protein
MINMVISMINVIIFIIIRVKPMINMIISMIDMNISMILRLFP